MNAPGPIYPATWPVGPLEAVAAAYAKFLLAIDWNDPLVLAGSREGRNKFLSNAWLHACGKGAKYHKTHLISESALAQSPETRAGLVWEHVIPKQRYIQEPLEVHARRGTLTVELVEEILRRYWLTAVVTRLEDTSLSRRGMPIEWDGTDVYARYRLAGIRLQPNPHFRWDA